METGLQIIFILISFFFFYTGQPDEEINESESDDPDDPPRFQKCDVRDVAELRTMSVPQKTKEKAQWAYNQFLQWRSWRLSLELPNECDRFLSRDLGITEFSEPELDEVLSVFISQVRKHNKDRYPGQTLYEMVTSIQKYFEVFGGKMFRLIEKSMFPKLYYTLDVEMKASSAQGIGTTVKKAEPISPESEEVLWNKNILGDQTPKSLLRAAFYLIGVNFGLRGGKEHRDLRASNLSFHKDSEGYSYVQYQQHVSKTNQGGLRHRKIEPHVARAYANTDSERCPVRILQLYMEKCPPEMLQKGFYLKPLPEPRKAGPWFCKVPIGIHTLEKMVCEIMKEANINGRYTNHSLRVTTVTRLFQEGLDTTLIMKQTGHRSETVATYKRVNDDQLRGVSSVLQQDKRSKVNDNCLLLYI